MRSLTALLLLLPLAAIACEEAPGPSCKSLGEHLAQLDGHASPAAAQERCTTMKWSAKQRRCFQQAETPNTAARCAEQVQSAREAMQLLCDAPKEAELANVDPASRSLTIAMYAKSRIVNPEVIDLLRKMAAGDHETKGRLLAQMLAQTEVAGCDDLLGVWGN